ncbi:MAG: GNAT family N-acetyltransferase [Deltaproteobacteria bacterium]|nr:GNAT family N-acetyltransferase [Deltaproteobacteria bacterium]
MAESPFTFRELTPRDWPDIEALFGPRGACGGCWCMWWRVERGGKLREATKGAPAKATFRELVESGRVRGILAFEGDVPVGWCSFGPRPSFPRLETVKAYRRDDGAAGWCVNCFFIAKDRRGRGVAGGLLDAAIAAARRAGAPWLEAYPVVSKPGATVPAVFAFMGPETLFDTRGFREVQRLSPSRPVVRLALS